MRLPPFRNLARALASAVALSVLISAFLAAAWDGGESTLRDARVMLSAFDSDEAIDIGDMEIGETRYLTTDSGKEVIVTREEDGFLLEVDGKEFRFDSINGNDVRLILGPQGEPGEDVDVMTWSGSNHIFLGRPEHLDDTVHISGLGDLDEYQREEIIDALRSVGVDKEIRFAPNHPRFHFFGTDDVDFSVPVEVELEEIGEVEGGKAVGIKILRVGEGEGESIIFIKPQEKEDED